MAASQPFVVEARSLGFSYGRHPALIDVSFTLESGLYALLGPNGAGKSTLLNLLAGLTVPTAGDLMLGGRSARSAKARSRWREQVGLLPQAPKWSGSMSARSFIEYFGRLRGLRRALAVERAELCLSMVGLADSAREPMSELSGGQLRRLFIAQALVHDPSLLVLDEPTAGLDPLARVELRELVGETREGRIVVMSTHLIEDVAHLSGQVLVLDAGRQVWRGSAAELGSVTHDTGHGSDRLGSAEEIGFIRLFEHADGEDQ